MSKLNDSLGQKTTGKDLFDLLKRNSSEYSRFRQGQLKGLAAVKAAAEIEGLLYPYFDAKLSGYELHYVKERITSDWLTALLVTVQPDNEKEVSARIYIKSILQGKMDSKEIDFIVSEFLQALSDDFRKMRSLKQSIYYRTRSVNAILKYFVTHSSQLSTSKCSSTPDAQRIIELLRNEYLEFDEGARFTRNSYFGEFLAYLQDVWPALVPDDLNSYEKSIDDKLRQSISNLEPLLSESAQLQSKYESFKSLLQKSDVVEPKLAQNESKASLEYKVLKNEGLIAVYTPESQSISVLKDFETRVLLASSSMPGLTQISVQIVSKPKNQLIVKCAGEINELVVVNFRRFIDGILS